MPGPRNNKKAKHKTRAGGNGQGSGPTGSSGPPLLAIPQAVDAIFAIDEIDGWIYIADFLCEIFNLPDLHKRSGLKKIHANFDEIYKKLDNVYKKNQNNDKIAGGIVGIWAKMSIDAVLRNKLVKLGLISRIMPLLEKPGTRVIGLQALSTVSHHGGLEVRLEVAKQVPALLRILEKYPEDSKIQELGVLTLSHAVGTVLRGDRAGQTLVKRSDVTRVMKLVLESIRKPNASAELVDHSLSVFDVTSVSCPDEMKAMPSLMSFLAACLRVNHIGLRSCALLAFLHISLGGVEREPRIFDTQKVFEGRDKELPQHLEDAMDEYGYDECETTILARTAREYQKAMLFSTQDKDLCELGRTLAEMILRTEYSITDGAFHRYNEKTGRMEHAETGLPFKMWIDALPHCAAALRALKNPADLDRADILEIKYCVIKDRIPESVILARNALARNPNVSYFYHSVSLTSDTAQSLRAVKQGLKAKQTTPFLNYYMLWRAVAHAGDMGVAALANSRAGEPGYAEGIAFLTSALEDAETFLKVAPPDTRYTTGVVHWYVALTMMIKGPQLSPDLKELKPALEKLETSRQLSEHFGFPYRQNQLRRTYELIMKHYTKGAEEYAETITHFDYLFNRLHEKEEKSRAEADDTLTSWLEHVSLEEGESDDPYHKAFPDIAFKSDTLYLYRCTRCGNPSAALKKCSGCGNARYCDTVCQKSHWSEHKAACNAARTK